MSLKGVPQLTYFCREADPSIVAAWASEVGVAVEPEWQVVQMEITGAGAMTLRRKMFAPNSAFSRIVLGTHNAARNGRELVEGGRQLAIDTVTSCDMILGAVFEPPLTAGDARSQLANSLAAAVGGVLFDGRWLMNSIEEKLVEVVP